MIDIAKIPVFGLNKDDKRNYMLDNMNYLTQFHIKNCSEYKTLMEKFGEIKQTYKEVSDVPFIPVRLFKHTNLISVPKKNIVKTMVFACSHLCIFVFQKSVNPFHKVVPYQVWEHKFSLRRPRGVLQDSNCLTGRHQCK